MQTPTGDLPYLTADLPGIGGELKQAPEDFEVEEVPAYEPCGEGDHLFLWIEKRDVPPDQLTRHIARTLGVSQGDIGMAGLKDRRATTRQYLSIPAAFEDRIGELDTERIRVLRSARHRNKLKTGHLQGNCFSILIAGVSNDALSRAEAIAARIRALGFPNYYGEQRFGQQGATLDTGLALLSGRKTPLDLPGAQRKFLLRLSLSAVQSDLFNQALVERMRDGLLHTVLSGDVMEVAPSGGKFLAENIPVEQARFDRGETLITGPMYGPKMFAPAGEVAEREAALLARNELSIGSFNEYKQLLPGTRRPYIIRLDTLEITLEPNGLRFRFALPSGVYATTLLREFMK